MARDSRQKILKIDNQQVAWFLGTEDDSQLALLESFELAN